MKYSSRRLLIFSVLCILTLSVVCLGGGLVFRSAVAEQRIREAVLQSLSSAFGDGISVDAVSVESMRRVVLDEVRYTGASATPLTVDVDKVMVNLRLPLVDLITGRLTATSFVSRIRLVQPVISWTGSPEQGPSLGLTMDDVMETISSEPELSRLIGAVDVLRGRVIVSGIPSELGSVSFEEVFLTASPRGNSQYSFDMTAQWNDAGGSPVQAIAYVDASEKCHEIDVTASDVLVSRATPLLHEYAPDLSDVEVAGGAMDVELRLERARGASSWVADCTLGDVALVHRAKGLGLNQVSGSLRVSPQGAEFRDVKGQLEGSWFTLAGSISSRGEMELNAEIESVDVSLLESFVSFEGVELSGTTALAGTISGTFGAPRFSGGATTSGIQVQVAGQNGPSSITMGPGDVSLVAGISGSEGSVSAHGTATAGSFLAGGVEVSDVVCEFRYTDGVLQFSEITGSLMGGELGGHLSLSLTRDGVSGVGQGRLRGVMSSKIPISGLSEALDARLDGVVSLTFSRRDGLGLAGQLKTLMPRVAGLTFDDGTVRFSCRNGLVSIDSLVLGLNGSEFVIKGDSSKGGEADVSLSDAGHTSERSILSPSS